VQVYNYAAGMQVNCDVVGTNYNGTTVSNGWQYANPQGYQTITMVDPNYPYTNGAFIGSAALYIECEVPYHSAVVSWSVD